MPQHRQLSDAIATHHGEVEDFDVEGGHRRAFNDRCIVAINTCTTEQIVCHGATKRLEPALCIVEVAHYQQAHQPIKDAAHQMTMERLTLAVRPLPLA